MAVCSTVVPNNPVSPSARIVFKALQAFFSNSGTEGGLWADSGSSSMSPGGSSSNSAQDLAPSIRSQVLQSGLMDALAAAMKATADSMTAAHAVRSQPELKLAVTPPDTLFDIWTHACPLWPEGHERLAVIAIAAPAAVQLLEAIMQVVSRDLPASVTAAAVPAEEGAASGMHGNTLLLCDSVEPVLYVVRWLATGITNVAGSCLQSVPELNPMLTVREFTTVLATMMVVTAEALLARQRLGPTATANFRRTSSSSSSARSRSSRSSSSSSRATDKASTQLNRKLEAMLRNLPECTKALLETLGMDSRAMVWAAAAQRDSATVEDLDSIAVTLVLCLQHAAVQTAMRRAEGTAKLQKMLLQIPAMLLHWAANTPVLTKEQELQCATNAVLLSSQCTQCWLQLDKTAYAKIDLDEGVGLVIDTQAPVPWLQPYFPAVWLEQVLPDAQKLLTVLLPYCWQQQATGTGHPVHPVLQQMCYVVNALPVLASRTGVRWAAALQVPCSLSLQGPLLLQRCCQSCLGVQSCCSAKFCNQHCRMIQKGTDLAHPSVLWQASVQLPGPFWRPVAVATAAGCISLQSCSQSFTA